MTRLQLATSFLTVLATLPAQSTLTTTFASDNSGSDGGATCFNLTAVRGITIGGIDCNLWDDQGAPGTIEMWVLPATSHVGHETNPTGWVLATSGPVTAAGLNQPSHVTFTAPYFMAPGNYGVAICHRGVGAAYTNGNGSNQNYSTPDLQLSAGSAVNACFTSGTVFSPRVWNGRIYYTLGNQIAQVQRSGTGCVDGTESFYEFFTGNGTFDLGNSSFEMVPNGTGYTVQRGTSTYVAPTGGGLALTDDSLSPLLSLGFSLPFPGGSTNQITVCSNGYIYLGAGSEADYTPSPGEALAGGRRLFPFWTDLLPDGSTNTNNVFFQVDAPNQRARVTWRNVPEYNNPSSSNTFQVVLNASGRIEFIYTAATNTVQAVLVGSSPGVNGRDPGTRDLTATMPFRVQRDSVPLTQDSTRPVLGTTARVTISGIPAGTLGGIEMIGPATAGIDLTGAGMPGCFLYVNPILVAIGFATTSNTATVQLPIPNDPALTSTQVPLQAATLSPGTTPLGAITSNLVTLFLGPL